MARRFRKVIIERAPGVHSVRIGRWVGFDEYAESIRRAAEAMRRFAATTRKAGIVYDPSKRNVSIL